MKSQGIPNPGYLQGSSDIVEPPMDVPVDPQPSCSTSTVTAESDDAICFKCVGRGPELSFHEELWKFDHNDKVIVLCFLEPL